MVHAYPYRKFDCNSLKTIRPLKNIFWKSDTFLFQFGENILNDNYKNIIVIFKGGLRPKLHSCFYGITLLILCRKRLAQSFVGFWSIFTKLWSHKLLNSAQITSYREYTKHRTPGFLCIFLLILWRKRLQQSFMAFLSISDELMKFQSFEWSNCVST